MSLTKWAVNVRMEHKGIKVPKQAERWILERYVSDFGKNAGFYKELPDGSVAFVGSPLVYSPFSNCFGWFPAVFPCDDPYQGVYKGMKAEQFIALLESMGFRPDSPRASADVGEEEEVSLRP